MVRSTRILHKNEEYLIQDDGASSASRTIIILARPESAAGAEAEGLQPIRTNLGDWVPIAKWEQERLTPIAEGASRLTPGLDTVLNIYLKRAQRIDAKLKRTIYYYVEKDGKLDYLISASHPHGLAVNIFSKKADAQKRLEEIAYGQIRQTNNLQLLLIKAADDGYGGAILDANEPVYFCLDRNEHIIFLRLSMNEEDEVDEHLLREDGSWAGYDGDADLEFFLDQDKCDENMIENLGDIPFIGYEGLTHFWTVEPLQDKGIPYILSEKDDPYKEIPESRSILLFRRKNNAMEFMMDRGLVHCEGVRIDDLKSFLRVASRNSLNVLLEPFGHRAGAGTLWLNGEDVILDTFSGFWVLEEGCRFKRAV